MKAYDQGIPFGKNETVHSSEIILSINETMSCDPPLMVLQYRRNGTGAILCHRAEATMYTFAPQTQRLFDFPDRKATGRTTG